MNGNNILVIAYCSRKNNTLAVKLVHNSVDVVSVEIYIMAFLRGNSLVKVFVDIFGHLCSLPLWHKNNGFCTDNFSAPYKTVLDNLCRYTCA